MKPENSELTIAIVSFILGALLAWILTLAIMGDTSEARALNKLIRSGHAYYTNDVYGEPVVKMREVKP